MGRTKVVRTPEEAAAIPPDRGVTVELQPDAPKVEEQETEKIVTAAEPEPVTEVEPLAADIEEQDEENTLAKQLAELKAAEELTRQQLAEANRRAEDAVRAAEERQRELLRERAGRDQAEFDSVLNAIGAAQAEADRAQGDLEAAYAAQDFRAVAEAQRRLSMATTRLVGLEDSKIMLETRHEERKSAPPPQVSGDPVVASIDAMTHLSARQREWLKSHRDAFTDPAKNAYLGAAHWDAIRAGHAQDSDAYFQVVEERLGYRQAKPEPQRKSIPVSAPVSRDAPTLSGAPARPSQIVLTKEQREAARIAGIDDFTYAKNLQKLQARKRDGFYQEQQG